MGSQSVTNYILNDLPQQKVSGSTMKPSYIRTGRSLAGMVLVLLGLSTYGCGDSATQTQPAELGSLSVSDGALDPQFNPATTSYFVQLSTDRSSTTITASPRVAGDTIRIDNQQTTSQTITLESPGTEKSINIVVTETGTGGTSKSYTVRVKRASLAGNNSLANLTVSPGTLAIPFDKDSPNYTVSVANNIERITVTPTLSDPLATMTVNGQPASSGQPSTVDLNGGGQTTTITITITAQDRSTKSYEVSVSRGPSNNNNLQGLTVSSGSLDPTFRANRTAYTVTVGSGVTSVTVRPTLADATATMTVNGTTVTSGQQSQPIAVGPGAAPTIITIIVFAQNGSPKPYSVTIARAANSNLSALTISPGTLDSPFNANGLSYTVNVGSGIDSVRVRPTLADPAATMTVNGQPVTSGQQSGPINLNPAGQPTSIQIVVTAQNQTTTKTYSVTVVRAALGANSNLSALAITPGALDSPFNANDLSYTVDVGSTVNSVRVRPTLDDSTATMTVNGQPATSGQQSAPITLNPAGQPTSIQIVVTAQNQTATKNYSVIVVRAALGANNNLSALTISPGTLDSPFNANGLSYTANVGSTVNSVRVRPTLDDSTASMTVNGQPATSGQQSAPITLNPAGQSTSIQIVVTAQNQTTTKTYSVTVVRAALGANNNLSALTISPGTLDSPFNANDLSYTVNVDSAVGSVTVSATKEDPNAVMLIGSVTVPAGTPSGGSTFPLNGAGGEPTPISITVTAQNGVDIKTYTISVVRPAAPTAPPRPASAPDLLTADDFCTPNLPPNQNTCFTPLPPDINSREDNLTNVKKPGFSVPLPGSGETAKLYMNGAEVASDSTPAGSTMILRPKAELPDGSYDVNYTLSNSNGESDKSPIMTPPLRIDSTIGTTF
jgi:trimeric autotransporter adhesin